MFVFITNIWEVLLELAPWLLLGLLLAGILHLYVPDSFVVRHLGKDGGIKSVLKAVVLGVPMPLCSCGVIPAALGIKKQGAGNGAATGFLISTPQTGIDSIMVSASMLGMPFAIFKLISAFITGFIGGSLVAFTDDKETSSSSASNSCSSSPNRTFKELYSFAIDDLLKMIWKWLLAGVIVSATITTWLPHDIITNSPLANPFIAMALMLVISLPMYVCATASVPIAAALVQAGMPAGAALVFLMAGPASNLTTIGAVYRALGLKDLIIYLGTIIICSFTFGYIFDFIVPAVDSTTHMGCGQHDNAIAIAAAALLLIFMAKFLYEELHSLLPSSEKLAQKITVYNVSGMTCQGCAAKVVRALENLDGVSAVRTDLDAGTVTISGSGFDAQVAKETIQKAGYQTD